MHIDGKDCVIALRDATLSAVEFKSISHGPPDEAQGSYCSRPQGSRNETPFRPLTEALDPYRAETGVR